MAALDACPRGKVGSAERAVVADRRYDIWCHYNWQSSVNEAFVAINAGGFTAITVRPSKLLFTTRKLVHISMLGFA
ncbi:MAG: hypothetical protein ACRESO_10115, partial [Gammaproteobacteria bacterium]